MTKSLQVKTAIMAKFRSKRACSRWECWSCTIEDVQLWGEQTLIFALNLKKCVGWGGCQGCTGLSVERVSFCVGNFHKETSNLSLFSGFLLHLLFSSLPNDDVIVTNRLGCVCGFFFITNTFVIIMFTVWQAESKRYKLSGLLRLTVDDVSTAPREMYSHVQGDRSIALSQAWNAHVV